MKNHILFILILLIGILCNPLSALNNSENQDTLEIKIKESTLIKMIIFDLSQKAISWAPDSDNRNKIYRETVKNITSKYKMDMNRVTDGYFDTGVEVDGHYDSQKGIASILLTFPTVWNEILHFNDKGELPDVKFRNGSLKFSVGKTDIGINFSNSLECFIDNKYLKFLNGEWIVDYQSKDDLTTNFWKAINQGDLTTAKKLIDKGIDINIKSVLPVPLIDTVTTNGIFTKFPTPLMYTAFNGDISIVNLLIDNGANINLQDEKGINALMLSSYKGNIEIIKTLISKGANVNLKARDGLTALFFTNNIEAVKILVANGADIDTQIQNDMTYIMSAVWRGNFSLVQLLIDSGANINLKSKDGHTAISIAEEEGYKDIVSILKKASAKK